MIATKNNKGKKVARRTGDHGDIGDDQLPIRSDVEFAPVSFLPGSSEKVAVMSERYSNGHPLWHPGDATCEVDRDREIELRGIVDRHDAEEIERSRRGGGDDFCD